MYSRVNRISIYSIAIPNNSLRTRKKSYSIEMGVGAKIPLSNNHRRNCKWPRFEMIQFQSSKQTSNSGKCARQKVYSYVSRQTRKSNVWRSPGGRSLSVFSLTRERGENRTFLMIFSEFELDLVTNMTR